MTAASWLLLLSVGVARACTLELSPEAHAHLPREVSAAVRASCAPGTAPHAGGTLRITAIRGAGHGARQTHRWRARSALLADAACDYAAPASNASAAPAACAAGAAVAQLPSLRPATAYSFEVLAEFRPTAAAAGRGAPPPPPPPLRLSGALSLRTPALGAAGSPIGPPPVTAVVTDRRSMAPGWTFFSLFPGGNNSDWAGAIMTDGAGGLGWYTDCALLFGTWANPKLLQHACGLTGTQVQLSNGNLLLMYSLDDGMVNRKGLTGLVEYSPVGGVLHTWAAVKGMSATQRGLIPSPKTTFQMDVYVMNHDVQELPNGHWMVIGFEQRSVSCGAARGPETIVGNEIVEFEPYTGKIVQRWSTFDAIDACATAGNVIPGTGEWMHLNSVDVHNVFAVDRNEMIVSTYKQGWIFAVRYRDDAGGKAGSLLWLLGGPNALPAANPAWFAQQPHFRLLPGGGASVDAWHATQHNVNVFGADGDSLILFDNGADTQKKSAALCGTPSRLLEYRIHARPAGAGAGAAALGNVSATWDYLDGGKSPYVGGAVHLANGNRLGNFGALTEPPVNAPAQFDHVHNCGYTHVTEVAPNGTVVMQLSAGGKTKAGKCYGYNGYRALRIPDPFAAVVEQSVEPASTTKLRALEAVE